VGGLDFGLESCTCSEMVGNGLKNTQRHNTLLYAIATQYEKLNYITT
jgi:hypothetical protein